MFVLIGFGLVFTPALKPAVAVYSRGLVSVSAHLLRVCGGRAAAEGPVLRNPLSGFAIEMKDGCNAVNVTILLWAAIAAFPAAWSKKATGLLLGTAAIQAINFVRFISLYYLGQYNMAWFEFAHGYLWESLIMLDALVVFALWVQTVFRARAMVDAVG
jgi:exosortase H (IPTLxxWG-CTERM-specific)